MFWGASSFNQNIRCRAMFFYASAFDRTHQWLGGPQRHAHGLHVLLRLVLQPGHRRLGVHKSRRPWSWASAFNRDLGGWAVHSRSRICTDVQTGLGLRPGPRLVRGRRREPGDDAFYNTQCARRGVGSATPAPTMVMSWPTTDIRELQLWWLWMERDGRRGDVRPHLDVGDWGDARTCLGYLFCGQYVWYSRPSMQFGVEMRRPSTRTSARGTPPDQQSRWTSAHRSARPHALTASKPGGEIHNVLRVEDEQTTCRHTDENRCPDGFDIWVPRNYEHLRAVYSLARDWWPHEDWRAYEMMNPVGVYREENGCGRATTTR